MKPAGAKTVVLIYPKIGAASRRLPIDPPLPLLALASPLMREGFDVAIIDAQLESDYAAVLDRFKTPPLCFGLSCMVGYQVQDAVTWTRLIREKFPESSIVWGGWFPTIAAEEVLTMPEVTAVIRGQGEESFTEYMKAIANGGNASELPEVYTRDGDDIVYGGKRPPVDPNDYPTIPYDLLEVDRYPKIRDGILNYSSSYGCPYGCQFCTVPLLDQRVKYKPLSPERVVADLKELQAKYNINYFEFFEDNFLYDRDRAVSIFKGIIRENLNIKFSCNGRINDTLRYDSEMIGLMKKAGVTWVGVGIESGSARVLKRIRKGITTEQALEAIGKFEEHGVTLHLNFMAGHHAETPEEYKETLIFIDKLRSMYDNIKPMLFFFVPSPGSAWFAEDISNGYIVKPATMDEWADYLPVGINPWLVKEDKRFFKQNRDIFKIMTFYYSMKAVEDFPFRINKRIPVIGKHVKRILAAGAGLRLRFDFYRLPAAWRFTRMLFRLAGARTKS